jgi:hypothetical protein
MEASMKDTPATSEPKEAASFLLAEYTALRNEILKRIEIQHQLISLALIAAGTFITLSKQASTTVILAFPVLALFLAIAWSHSEVRIRQIAVYILCIEDKLLGGNRGWEHMRGLLISEKLGSRMVFASRGIFIGTQILAIIIVLAERGLKNLSTRDYWFIVSDILIVLLTAFILRRYKAERGSLTLDYPCERPS